MFHLLCNLPSAPLAPQDRTTPAVPGFPCPLCPPAGDKLISSANEGWIITFKVRNLKLLPSHLELLSQEPHQAPWAPEHQCHPVKQLKKIKIKR